MTSREIIIRNLNFDGAERIGLAFTGNRYSDFAVAGLGASSTWEGRRWIEGDTEYYDDEWGNIWHRKVGLSAGGEIYKPVLQDWSDLDKLHVPDFGAQERFVEARKKFSAEPERYSLGALPGFVFSICRYLRKMEVYFQDLMLERENVDRLHGLVADVLEEVITGYAAAGADGVFFCEDWGIQDRLLISPNTWREVFRPLYERLCHAAHSRGMHVLMHSCGYNRLILDDLAAAGINCFQFDQPEIYGLEELAQKLRELKVCLYSPVDIQKVMPTGDKELIEDTARRMAELFGGPEGGFIAKNYGDIKGIGVKEEWDEWAYQAFLECAKIKPVFN